MALWARVRRGVLLVVVGLVAVSALAQGEYRVAVPLDTPREQIRLLRSLDFDVHSFDFKTNEAFVGVDDARLAELRGLGFAPRIVEELPSGREGVDALSDYHDEVETAAAVDRIASEHPGIAHRFEYADPTREGRTVSGLIISDNADLDEAEPRIFFVSQHHAREVMTPEALLDMADLLTDGYGSDPEVTAWVDEYQIVIVPCHNPDGTHHVFNVYSNWRKNRRDNGDGTFGVDPNRNYPYAWGPAGCNGSSGSPSSDTYRGPTAGSEPITQSIMALARDVEPSNALTYHTYSELVLHPMGCEPALPDDPDLRAHRDVGSALAASIVNDAGDGWYKMGTAYELLYDVDGGSDDWFHTATGTVIFTIEMNASIQGFQPDYATWRDDTIARNREGWRTLLRRMGGPSITGFVRDACSGAPLDATVGIAEQVLSQGQEPRTTIDGHGLHHRIVGPGEYTFFAEASGYTRQDWSVEVGQGPATQDVWLVPTGQMGLFARGLAVLDGSGDDDGQLDPGEEVELGLTVLAAGEALSGASARLISESDALEVLSDTVTIGSVPAGGELEAPERFRVRALGDAADGALAALRLVFEADQTLCRAEEPASLRITRGVPSVPYEIERMDADPGWTIDGPSGGWEFGAPSGSGGAGGPDAAHTGDYVYGTVLGGNYGGTEGEFVLTSTPFDLEGLRDVELRYRRWLNNEPGYDIARIEVSIDENEWTEVWRGFGRDAAWEEYRLAMPDVVDEASSVWVRFILRQDGGGSRSGFYIDDVSFAGESVLVAGGKLRYEEHTLIEDDPLYGNGDGALDAGETARLAVRIRSTRSAESTSVRAQLSTDAPGVTLHDAVADYPDLPPGEAALSLAPHFSFSAGPDCAARIPFLLEVFDASGAVSTSRFTLRVGSLAEGTLFVDDMETDKGWAGSGSDQGAWERAEPAGNYYQGALTNPNEDHSAAPGSFAWVTQNVPPPQVVPPQHAEVDGQVVLTSPPLAAGAWERLELSLWRWFYTGGGPGPDRLRIEVSDGKGGFRALETLGTLANTWTETNKSISELVTPHDGLVLRIVAVDDGGESIVEAGIDDVVIDGTYYACDSYTPTPLDPPLPVGNTLRVTRSGYDVELSWDAPAEDPGHGPATSYIVRRGDTPDALAPHGEPLSARFVDVGAAGPSASALFTYLVAAQNSGGSE